jgi:subtilisin family serine protease
MVHTMKNITLWRTIVAFVCGLSLSLGLLLLGSFGADAPSYPPGEKQIVPPAAQGHFLAKPKKGVREEDLAGLRRKHGVQVKKIFPRLGNLQVLRTPGQDGLERAMEAMRQSGLFEYVEPDYVLTVHDHMTPDDPSYTDGSLWGLHNVGQNGGTADADIDAPEAWHVRTSAEPVIVAVIDTGIRYTHEDLAANMWINPGEIPGNGVDDDNNGFVDDVYGVNAIVMAGDPMDDHGHGTHVAGTIGAAGDNARGVVGIAWRVQLMACKFLASNGSGLTSDAITCVDYAVAMGARVMNNSWGGGAHSQALEDAIVAARDAGIVFVASAGNDGADLDAYVKYPAEYDVDNVLAVAATDRNDRLASFSNFGVQSVELGAPGVFILSSHGGGDTNYAYFSGTSMAAPHVSGAAALMLAQFPSMTYREVIDRLVAGTDPVDALSGRTISGGRLNLHRSLSQDPLPFFAATPLSGEVPLAVSFSNLSVGAVTSLSWDFGDGSPPQSGQTASHTYNSAGAYTAQLTANGPGGSFSRSRKVTGFTSENYRMEPGTFAWIDPGGMTNLNLGDDTVSQALPMPFLFSFYNQAYSNVYVSANGLLGFAPVALNTYVNGPLPTTYAPNNAIYPYWDDFNPLAHGSVRFGFTGGPQGQIAVISWLDVIHFSDGPWSNIYYSFQALLHENSHEIIFQYLQVEPGGVNDGGGSATIGIENEQGQIASLYSWNGAAPVTNGQAIRFVMDTVVPRLALSPSTMLHASGAQGGPFAPGAQAYVVSNASGGSLVWTSSVTRSFIDVMPAGGVLEADGSMAVSVGLNAQANNLGAGQAYFSTDPAGGVVTRAVSVSVQTDPIIAVTPLSTNFGNVNLGNWKDIVFVVRNAGGSVLDGSAAGSGPFGILSGSPYSLGANAVTNVVVRFAPQSDNVFTQLVAFTGGGGAAATVTGRGCATPNGYPTGLKGSVSGNNVTLTWKDNSTNEEGFRVLRQQKFGNAWGSWGEVGRVAPDITGYVDGGLAAAQYQYQVRGFRCALDSDPSNTAKVNIR